MPQGIRDVSCFLIPAVRGVHQRLELLLESRHDLPTPQYQLPPGSQGRYEVPSLFFTTFFQECVWAPIEQAGRGSNSFSLNRAVVGPRPEVTPVPFIIVARLGPTQ